MTQLTWLFYFLFSLSVICLVCSFRFPQDNKIHTKFDTGEKLVLDRTSIFAQVDAFVQRCKDLLEVSELLK